MQPTRYYRHVVGTTGPQPNYERIVREVPLLARLSESDLAALAQRGGERDYPEGAIVFREGDVGDALHIVVAGRVRISILSSEGEEMALHYLEAGECFGELAILDGGLRTATASAAIATRTFVVTREAFIAWLSDRPEAALALLATLSLRLRRTDQTLADLNFLDLSHRLAKKLLQLSSSAGTRDHGSAVWVTQSELGAMLGVSRESVNKTLNTFQRQGWISLSRGGVTINDPIALRTIP